MEDFPWKWNQVKRIHDSLNQWNMHEIRQCPERIDFTHKEMRLDNSILLFRNFFFLYSLSLPLSFTFPSFPFLPLTHLVFPTVTVLHVMKEPRKWEGNWHRVMCNAYKSTTYFLSTQNPINYFSKSVHLTSNGSYSNYVGAVIRKPFHEIHFSIRLSGTAKSSYLALKHKEWVVQNFLSLDIGRTRLECLAR